MALAGALVAFMGLPSIVVTLATMAALREVPARASDTLVSRGERVATAIVAAALAGSVLAVCSCTIVPLFAGIYKKGAGLGPATTFLYAGPAINVLAIILSMKSASPLRKS